MTVKQYPAYRPSAPIGLGPQPHLAGLHGLRLHDLRHSFASVGASSGLGLPIIGKLLGHTQAATTQRYAHLADGPLRKASEAIAAHLENAMNGLYTVVDS